MKRDRQGGPASTTGLPARDEPASTTELRVAIATLGCKVNAYDSATIAERLRAAGCRLVALEAGADRP